MRPEALYWKPDALCATSAARVRIRWLGTAGFAIEHDGWTVLLDPYVTRAPLSRCIFHRLQSDEVALAAHVPRADAIVLGHTHFDHALDAPLIARRTGATVYGSKSAAVLCRASGVPETSIRVVEREPGAPPAVAEVGPFELRFFPSAHSRLAFGRVPFDGEIADCDDVPMPAPRYRCGAVFSVEIRVASRTVVHIGSAELVEERLATREADLVLLCVAGWTSSRDFPTRVVRALEPRAILLSHWDNFFRPIDEPARPLPAIRFGELADRLATAAKDVPVGALPLLGTCDL